MTEKWTRWEKLKWRLTGRVPPRVYVARMMQLARDDFERTGWR